MCDLAEHFTTHQLARLASNRRTVPVKDRQRLLFHLGTSCKPCAEQLWLLAADKKRCCPLPGKGRPQDPMLLALRRLAVGPDQDPEASDLQAAHRFYASSACTGTYPALGFFRLMIEEARFARAEGNEKLPKTMVERVTRDLELFDQAISPGSPVATAAESPETARWRAWLADLRGLTFVLLAAEYQRQHLSLFWPEMLERGRQFLRQGTAAKVVECLQEPTRTLGELAETAEGEAQYGMEILAMAEEVDGNGAAMCGDLQKALQHFLHMIFLIQPCPIPGRQAEAWLVLSSGWLSAEVNPVVLHLLRIAEREARAAHNPKLLLEVAHLAATYEFEVGEYAAARERLQSHRPLYRQAGTPRLKAHKEWMLGLIGLHQGSSAIISSRHFFAASFNFWRDRDLQGAWQMLTSVEVALGSICILLSAAIIELVAIVFCSARAGCWITGEKKQQILLG